MKKNFFILILATTLSYGFLPYLSFAQIPDDTYADEDVVSREEAIEQADNQTITNAWSVYNNAIKPGSLISLEELTSTIDSVNEIIGRRASDGSALGVSDSRHKDWQLLRTNLYRARAQRYPESDPNFDMKESLAASQAIANEKARIDAAVGNKSELEKACDAKYSYFNPECVTYGIATVLMWILWMFSQILIGVNKLFNLVINYTVVEFNEIANDNGLRIAWRTVRDLVNVSLLFVLLYAAIGMITEIGNIDSKRIVKNVILVALLINFSFFFTGVAIKASNTVTVFLYNRIASESGQTAGTPDITARIFAGRINPSFGKLPASEPGKPTQNTFGGIIGNFAGDFILIILMSIALVAAAIMFAARFIKLLILLVLSPLAFLGFAIGGKAGGKAGDWLNSLINNCIFPIVFLIFLVMVAAIGSSGALTQSEGLIGSLVMAIIINGLVVAGLIAAQTLGAAGAAGAMGLLNKVKGGALGFAGQRTLGKAGYAANRALSGDAGQKFVARNPRLGMALKNFSEKVSGAKFGGKGSFKKDIEERAKLVEKFDTAENKATYISNLNKPLVGKNIPYVSSALNTLPLVGGFKQAQQASFEKLKPKDQAEVQAVLEKKQPAIQVNPKVQEIDKQLEAKKKEIEENQKKFENLGTGPDQAGARLAVSDTRKKIEQEITILEGKKKELSQTQPTTGRKTLLQTLRGGLTTSKLGKLDEAIKDEADKKKLKDYKKRLDDGEKFSNFSEEDQKEYTRLAKKEAEKKRKEMEDDIKKLKEKQEKSEEGGGEEKERDKK